MRRITSKADTSDVEAAMDGLETLVDSLCSDLQLPGLVVTVVESDREEPTFAVRGQSDVESSTPVAPTTVFRVGSVSKTVTAIAVMQLVEQDAIGLDDPVEDHVDVPVDPWHAGDPPITVRHLLTHTSGIGEVSRPAALVHPVRAMGGTLPGKPPVSLPVLLRGGVHAMASPGTRWAYSNSAFNLLGLVVEQRTGAAFADAVATNVLQPLGMDSSGFRREDLIGDSLAAGYRVSKRGPARGRDFDIVFGPAGGLFSSAPDLARIATAVMCGGANASGRVLASVTLNEMLTPEHQPHPRLPPIGLAFWLWDIGGQMAAGHGGTVPGFSTGLLASPGAGLGVVALANRTVMPSAAFGGGHVAAEVFRHLTGVPSASSSLRARAVDEAPAVWPDVVGTYRPEPGLLTSTRAWQYLGGALHVTVQDGHLDACARTGPLRRGVRMVPVDAGDPLAFNVGLGPYVMHCYFTRAADGAVDGVWFGFTPCPFRLVRR